jgi:phosphoribosylglycinamide formyltransferase 1
VKKIAVFASGSGSNAEKIIERLTPSYAKASEGKPNPSPVGEGSNIAQKIKVALVVCNKPGAGVLKIAEENKIPTLLIEKEKFFHGDAYVGDLKIMGIDFIILAGFLWKIPDALIKSFPKKIINIHPALLPNYGGKGMYGRFVHEAVIANKEKESGITIHYVDEQYDNGDIIFQARCPVLPDDTVDTLAARIQKLEHEHFPTVIERIVTEGD